MPIRIIKVKGKKYAQKVEYQWDPIKKAGKTIVLKHIGPVKPLNPERYKQVKFNISSSTKIVTKKRKKVNQSIEEEIIPVKKTKDEWPPLTPPTDIITEVLKLVSNSDKKLNRNEVFDLFLQMSQRTPDDPKTLKTNIGFALTILEREGKLSRVGMGGRRDPYHYWSK